MQSGYRKVEHPYGKHGDWNPLEDAKWFIDKLHIEIDTCNATGMAGRSAGAVGNIEAAFYEKRIDEDTMVIMKNNVEQLIHQFDQKCKCQHR